MWEENIIYIYINIYFFTKSRTDRDARGGGEDFFSFEIYCAFGGVRIKEGGGVINSRWSDDHDGSCRYETDVNNHKGWKNGRWVISTLLSALTANTRLTVHYSSTFPCNTSGCLRITLTVKHAVNSREQVDELREGHNVLNIFLWWRRCWLLNIGLYRQDLRKMKSCLRV